MSKWEQSTPSQRHLRIGEELRHSLAMILERGEVRDPGLGGICVTVTEAVVNPDLRRVVFYVMPFGGGDKESMVNTLNRARPFLRRKMASAVKLRYMPEISFIADTSLDNAEKIDALLNDSRVADDLEKDR